MPSRGEVWLVEKAERFLGKLSAQQLALVEAGVRDWLAL